MSTSVIGGVVRRFTKIVSSARDLRMTGLESLAVAQVEPPYTELARAGRRFMGGTQILANGIAPVQAIPTTSATLLLYNGESQGSGKSYAVDRLAFYLASGTSAAGATLLAAVTPTPILSANAPGANATGYASSSCSGSSNKTKSFWGTAITIPAGASWLPVLSNLQAAAANVGQGELWVDLQGGLVIPPGCGLGLAVLSGVGTTPLYGVGAMWSELELDLE